jgi:predicted nucleotide-binding protein
MAFKLKHGEFLVNMARRATPAAAPPPAKLLVSINDAREKLVSRREQGSSLLAVQRSSVNSSAALEQAEAAYGKWNDFNKELLRRIFDTEEYSDAYGKAGVYSFGIYSIGGGRDVYKEIEDHFSLFNSKIEYLDSLAERLDLIDVAPSVFLAERTAPAVTSQAEPNRPKSNKKVFIVHGQDSETKAIVARFIEHCGLEPVILHEQADQGRTIIEKFEQTSDVGFAVILLTPDDLGGLAPAAGGTALDNAKPRARQNVILELGYFIGKLGRNGVCALKKGDVELPSDFSGVVYTPYDGADEGWKIKLAREMKAAGLEVDLNKAFA